MTHSTFIRFDSFFQAPDSVFNVAYDVFEEFQREHQGLSLRELEQHEPERFHDLALSKEDFFAIVNQVNDRSLNQKDFAELKRLAILQTDVSLPDFNAFVFYVKSKGWALPDQAAMNAADSSANGSSVVNTQLRVPTLDKQLPVELAQLLDLMASQMKLDTCDHARLRSAFLSLVATNPQFWGEGERWQSMLVYFKDNADECQALCDYAIHLDEPMTTSIQRKDSSALVDFTFCYPLSRDVADQIAKIAPLPNNKNEQALMVLLSIVYTNWDSFQEA